MAAQYRPLIMFAVGMTFVYWIISLHSAPYPYPHNIMVSREDLFGAIKPNGIFISVQGDWVYLTAIWKEHEVKYEYEDATGLIRQYRRPLHLILSHNKSYDSNNDWQLLYNHRLDGPITHISSFYYNDGSSTNTGYSENNALAILYQLHGKEEIKYIIRLYLIGSYEPEISDTNDLGECHKFSPHTCHITPSFKFQDIILPGTTNIKSFHVDGSIILYSRSPDDAKFRTILIPENVFEVSKSRIDALTLKSSDSGPIQKIGSLDPVLRKTSTFRRVYAVPGVIRVLNVEVTASDEIWTFQVTVIHNSSSPSEETDMRFRWRSKKLIAYTPSSTKKVEYDLDFVRGIALAPIVVPKPIVVTARNVTTICIALSNILFTFDYSNTTTTDSNQQDTHSTEAYIVRSEYLPVLEESPFQAVGTEINANGNLLVLVTQENYILIYKRGDADINDPLSTRTRKGWFAGLINSDSRQNLMNKQTEENWELRMVISSSYLDFLSQSDLNNNVMAVKILNVSGFQSNENILLNLFENGDVATFDLDKSEQEVKWWFIIRKQLLMYTGMVCVVLVFVWNETKM